MKIFIDAGLHGLLTFELSPETTIGQLKQLVHTGTNEPVAEMGTAISFNGRCLEDDAATLATMGVVDGSSLVSDFQQAGELVEDTPVLMK